MSTYKITIIENMEGEDEEEALEALCRFICHNGGGTARIELVKTSEEGDE